jgi:hypothetical protein
MIYHNALQRPSTSICHMQLFSLSLNPLTLRHFLKKLQKRVLWIQSECVCANPTKKEEKKKTSSYSSKPSPFSGGGGDGLLWFA